MSEGILLVADVHALPDHIACDDATRSELVIPITVGGCLRAVLDLDSPHPGGFSASVARILEAPMAHTFSDAVHPSPGMG